MHANLLDIDLLNSLRSTIGVAQKNPYVFARANRDSLEPQRGSDCLRSLTLECAPKLKHPKNITGSNLRKYIATISQVLSLKEQEIDWLARHLGRDIRTHREYYRLHEGTIELAKVSKLLLAVDSGKAGSLKGKNLEEINIEGRLRLNVYIAPHVIKSKKINILRFPISSFNQWNCMRYLY
jgi:hypothetical protein